MFFQGMRRFEGNQSFQLWSGTAGSEKNRPLWQARPELEALVTLYLQQSAACNWINKQAMLSPFFSKPEWFTRRKIKNASLQTISVSVGLGFNFDRFSSYSFDHRMDSGSPQAPPGMTVFVGRRYNQNLFYFFPSFDPSQGEDRLRWCKLQSKQGIN